MRNLHPVDEEMIVNVDWIFEASTLTARKNSPPQNMFRLRNLLGIFREQFSLMFGILQPPKTDAARTGKSRNHWCFTTTTCKSCKDFTTLQNHKSKMGKEKKANGIR